MTRRKHPQPEDETSPIASAEAEVSDQAADAQVDSTVESAPASLVDPVPVTPKRRLGVFGPILGGAIAAVAGFGVSHFNLFGLAAPDASAELATLSRTVQDLGAQQAAGLETAQAELAALEKRISQLEAAPQPTTPDLSRLDDLDQRLAAIEALPADGVASGAAVMAKLAELERRMAALPATTAAPELQAELDAALARLGEAEAAATARAAEAEAARLAAEREKALDRLTNAVASGAPFAAELEATTDQALQESLGPWADTGAPTLDKLKAAFPEGARAALQVARDISTEDGFGDRLVDFLAAQTGARSLAPREGDDPDAILSRAEFALSEARVADALSELQALDPVIRAPMDPWIQLANAYLTVVAALQTARGE